MKRISSLLMVLALCVAQNLPAQDAATEERLNKLGGQIEDLIANQRAQQKQLESLAKEIEAFREQIGKPTGNYASQDEVKSLATALKEVDRKRIEDAEHVSAQLARIGTKLSAPLPPKKNNPGAGSETSTTDKPPKDEKGYPYVIQSGDTLSVIVQAYREKNIKVTTDQILKANPGLKPEKLKVGQKIWIPAPQS
jgi:LysM repeat protein